MAKVLLFQLFRWVRPCLPTHVLKHGEQDTAATAGPLECNRDSLQWQFSLIIFINTLLLLYAAASIILAYLNRLLVDLNT